MAMPFPKTAFAYQHNSVYDATSDLDHIVPTQALYSLGSLLIDGATSVHVAFKTQPVASTATRIHLPLFCCHKNHSMLGTVIWPGGGGNNQPLSATKWAKPQATCTILVPLSAATTLGSDWSSSSPCPNLPPPPSPHV